MFAIGFGGLFTLILLCEFKIFESSRGGGIGGPESTLSPFSLDPNTKHAVIFRSYF